MRLFKWLSPLIVGLVLMGLFYRYQEELTRIVVKQVGLTPPPVTYTDPDVLEYILSYRLRIPPLTAIDYLIFAPLQARLALHEKIKTIDVKKLLQGDVATDTYSLQGFIKTVPGKKHTRRLVPALPKSGFDIGREGLVYKVVIPLNDKVLNIMELGVEPDQTEDIENISLSPKASFQVVIPLK